MSDSPTVQPAGMSREERDAAIQEFAAKFFPGKNQELYENILLTMCRLQRDDAARGDMKLLSKSLAEMRYGLKVFAPYKGVRKVSIYGSSRTPEGHPDYEAAEEFARLMGVQGWFVITGAGDGIMRAGHGGAGRDASFGVAIRLPFEQKTNDIIAEDPKLANFRYFFTRKLMFMKEASAIALFPGGFGTQDENFEALTLVQTGKAPIMPIVMCEQEGGTYWAQWRAYVISELLRTGMISESDMSLFRITDRIEVAVAEIVNFYRVYHSARYVNDELLLRVRVQPNADQLRQLNDEFARLLLTRGKIEASPALPMESGEHPELARLRLHFDRRSVGALRRLIDTVNRWELPAAEVGKAAEA